MQPLFPAEVNRAMRRGGREGFLVSRRTRVIAVVCLAAVVAPAAGAEPLSSDGANWLLSAAIAAIAAYFASSARRGPLLLASIVVLLTARTTPSIAAGAVAIAASALSTRNLRRRAVFARGATGGAVAVGLLAADGELHPLLLGSVWLVAGVCLIGSGWVRTPREVRRAFMWGAIAAAGYAVVACALAGLVVADSAHLVDSGIAELRSGLAAARSGDAAGSGDHLERARAALEDAGRRIQRFGLLARAVPVAAQHVDAVSSVLEDVALAASQARQAASIVEDRDLTVRAGRLDLDVVASLSGPLHRLTRALGGVVSEVRDHESSPLVPPLRSRLHELEREAARAWREAAIGAEAADVVPGMLGAGGTRRYLVLVTSPAEARGRFGFPGSFAEVEFADGRFLLREHGSVTQRFTGLKVDQSAFDLGDPRIRPYEPMGVTRELQATTIPPDFPVVAANAAEIWEQSGRAPVDGVVRFDPASIAPLLAFTGPIQVPGLPEPLTPANVQRFLVRDQYLQFPDDQAPRRELLETVADRTFERLETAELPPPRTLFDLFGPLVETDDLQMASFDRDAQRLLTRAGLDGALPPPGSDGLLVTTVNGLGNKIDALLSTELTYTGRVRDGRIDATAEIQLRNAAPARGLPRYVIGSSVRPAPPAGTNRSTVLLYTAAPIAGATVDGSAADVVSGRTGPWWVHQLSVEIPPQSTSRIVVKIRGGLPSGPYRLRIVPGGAASPSTVKVDLVRGGERITYRGRPLSEVVLR